MPIGLEPLLNVAAKNLAPIAAIQSVAPIARRVAPELLEETARTFTGSAARNGAVAGAKSIALA